MQAAHSGVSAKPALAQYQLADVQLAMRQNHKATAAYRRGAAECPLVLPPAIRPNWYVLSNHSLAHPFRLPSSRSLALASPATSGVNAPCTHSSVAHSSVSADRMLQSGLRALLQQLRDRIAALGSKLCRQAGQPLRGLP